MIDPAGQETPARILLIEDNPGDARLIREMASESPQLSAEIVWHHTLAEGLACLETMEIDAVLVDLGLPDSDGLETLRALDPHSLVPPVIVLTGRTGDELTSASLREGAQDYLVKDGLGPEQLERSVRYAVARRASELERIRAEQRYRSLFEASPEALILVDEEGAVRDANPAAEALFGYAPGAILGERVEALMPAESRSVHRRERAEYQADPVPKHKGRELLALHRDGRVLDVDIGLSPMSMNGSTWTIAAVRDITDRKEAQRSLEESAHRLREAQRIAGLGHWEWNVDSDAIEWSGETARIFGVAGERVTLTTDEFFELLHPEDRKRLRDQLEALGEGTDSAEILLRVNRRDGEQRFVLSRAEVRKRSESRPTLMTGVVYDVTEQHRAREALLESESRFRTAFDRASTGMALVDDEGGFQEANDALCAMLGFTREDLRGMSFLDITHPDDRDVSLEAFARVWTRDEASFSFEKRYVRKDGGVLWVLLSAAAFPAEAGASIRYIAQIQDITERKEAVERLRRSEAKYAHVFQTSPVGITITTLEGGRFLEVNPAYAAIFGCEPEELVGRTTLELDMWGDTRDRSELVRRVRAGHGSSPMESHVRTRSGELIPIEISGAKLEVDGEEYLLALTRDVSERQEFQRELERRALYDPLTGLPNRSLFRDRLEHALDRAPRSSTWVSVALLDLDRFKIVNDSLGHGRGDELLAAVARRLAGSLRRRDTLARLGGDEFAVLLETVDTTDIEPIIDRLLDAFAEPFPLEGSDVRISASVGIVTNSEEVGTAEDLLRLADVAMYEAKREAGSHFHVFDADRDEAETHRLRRETQLYRALENEEFRLFYQPVVELASGRIVGAEALIRWQHPVEGLVSPGEFIPIAEETGFIVPMGAWVKRTACARTRAWIDAFDRPDFEISVNLSALHFELPDFLERIDDTLRSADLPASNLQIELTERALLRGLPQVGGLRDRGVRVAVDDLGTGYSSLEYLIRLDVDTLKIDRAIVSGVGQDPRNTAVVESILLIADRLGLGVIAEGIETEAQRGTLEQLGCRFGQGYLLGRPMPPEAFEELLR
jgi:diguanylate cyclase (GGDEF)-like protein/PAS domain S-box-containing protein